MRLTNQSKNRSGGDAAVALGQDASVLKVGPAHVAAGLRTDDGDNGMAHLLARRAAAACPQARGGAFGTQVGLGAQPALIIGEAVQTHLVLLRDRLFRGGSRFRQLGRWGDRGVAGRGDAEGSGKQDDGNQGLFHLQFSCTPNR